ncbi:hypothetical protein SAMN05216357_12811 [Porphyromonadaceae bacterium KH3CP3RA]|nr:hypothetical protein SAMN05216357_12811 [Porphyromonadaceae bacterium KH3CP3RA]
MKITDATLLRQMETDRKVYFFNILYDPHPLLKCIGNAKGATGGRL